MGGNYLVFGSFSIVLSGLARLCRFWSCLVLVSTAVKLGFQKSQLSFQTSLFITTETHPEEDELSRGGANEAIALKEFKLLLCREF